MNKFRKAAIITVIAIAVVALAMFLFAYFNGLSGLHTHTEAREGQIKVACVGDSITYGHGINNWPKNNYPAVLQSILGDEYHVQNFGHSGKTLQNTTDQPYTGSDQYKLSLEYKADVVVFMLGSNDSRVERWIDSETFTAEFEERVNSYKKNDPNVRIILCTPACAFFDDGKTEGETDFGLRPTIIQEIATNIRVFALAEGYELVDIYDLTKNHAEWFEADNVHPSNDGARAIAELIAKKINP